MDLERIVAGGAELECKENVDDLPVIAGQAGRRISPNRIGVIQNDAVILNIQGYGRDGFAVPAVLAQPVDLPLAFWFFPLEPELHGCIYASTRMRHEEIACARASGRSGATMAKLQYAVFHPHVSQFIKLRQKGIQLAGGGPPEMLDRRQSKMLNRLNPERATPLFRTNVLERETLGILLGNMFGDVVPVRTIRRALQAIGKLLADRRDDRPVPANRYLRHIVHHEVIGMVALTVFPTLGGMGITNVPVEVATLGLLEMGRQGGLRLAFGLRKRRGRFRLGNIGLDIEEVKALQLAVHPLLVIRPASDQGMSAGNVGMAAGRDDRHVAAYPAFSLQHVPGADAVLVRFGFHARQLGKGGVPVGHVDQFGTG